MMMMMLMMFFFLCFSFFFSLSLFLEFIKLLPYNTHSKWIWSLFQSKNNNECTFQMLKYHVKIFFFLVFCSETHQTKKKHVISTLDHIQWRFFTCPLTRRGSDNRIWCRSKMSFIFQINFAIWQFFKIFVFGWWHFIEW